VSNAYFEAAVTQIDLRECLLSFSTESLPFQFGIQKYKDKGIQNCKFTCCFVWV